MTKNKIKNYLYIVIWPIIFIIGQVSIRLIFAAVFHLNNSKKYTNDLYFDKLSAYINSNAFSIAIITAIIFIPLYYLIYKKYKQNSNKLNIKYLLIAVSLGISVSIIYNILMYNLNLLYPFTDSFEKNNIPIYIQLLSSGLIGPIIEELIFRGIVYNKLKEFNKPMKAIIICSILFGIIHLNPMEMLYAFGVSFLFIYLYEKNKSLIYPIVMHIVLNISAIILVNYVDLNNLYIVISFIIGGILILIPIKKLIVKDL